MKTDSHTLVLSLQFDDEGGKDVIKALYATNDVYIRFNGSISNTSSSLVKSDSNQIQLHNYYPNAINVITQGVLLDLEVLATQVHLLRKKGYLLTSESFFISHLCQLIMPWHTRREEILNNEINHEFYSTIFALSDKIIRRSFRVIDLFSPTFKKHFLNEGVYQNKLLKDIKEKEIDLEKAFVNLVRSFLTIQDFVTDTYVVLEELGMQKKNFLFETPLGLMQDINTGPATIVSPFACTPEAIISGTGLMVASKNIGIFSPFISRSSAILLPNEFTPHNKSLIVNNHNKIDGNKLIDSIAWLDIPMLKYALKFDIDEIALVRLNYLSNIDEIHVCTQYMDLYQDLERTYSPSFDFERESVTRIYESFSSWHEDLSGRKKFKDLPKEAREFIQEIENLIARKINYIVLGAQKDEIIYR